MAEREAASGSHKWNETAAWVGGVVPKEPDDVVFTASSGEVKLSERTRIRSLKATSSFVSKLVFEAAAELEIFGGKAPYIILWEAGESTIEVVPLNTGFTIQLVGGETREVTLPTNAKVELTINVGKLKLATKISVKAINVRFEGEFESNGQNMTLIRFELEGGELPTLATFNPGTVCTVNTFFVEKPQTNTSLEASGAKIVIESQLQTSSIGTEASKGTATWGEVEFLPKAAGQTFLLGTSTFKKLILNNTNGAKEFRFPNGLVTTVTETIEVIPGSSKVKWAAETAGQKFKIKKATGTVQIENTELKGSVAEGGAVFKDLNGKSLGENSGWIFEFTRGLTAKLEWSAILKEIRIFIFTPKATFEPSGKVSTIYTQVKHLASKLEFSEFMRKARVLTSELKFSVKLPRATKTVRKATLTPTVKFPILIPRPVKAILQTSIRFARTTVAQRIANFTPKGFLRRTVRVPQRAMLELTATILHRARVKALEAQLLLSGKRGAGLFTHALRGSLRFTAAIPRFVEYMKRLLAALGFSEEFTQPEKPEPGQFDYVFLAPQSVPTLVVLVENPWPLPIEDELLDVPELLHVNK